MDVFPCFDFDLKISEGLGQHYPVVARVGAREAQTSMEFPFDDTRLENYLLKLQQALNPSSLPPQRRKASVQEQPVLEFGRALFEALLSGAVGHLYADTLREAQRQKRGVRLRLHFEAPELAVLPWEYLYDPAQGDYLCLYRETPLVRYIDTPYLIEPLQVELPLRILGMIARPSDEEQLDTATEQAQMEAALAPLLKRGLMTLHWMNGGRWRDLQREMRGGPWHIFHFIGHSGFDPRSGEGVIALETDAGKTHPVKASDLRLLLADQKSLRLVVLNACQGALGNQEDLFSSSAAILVQKGIPAVLAMQANISDEAALVFTRCFYETLGDGFPVDAAVTEARKAVRGERAVHTLEWGTPVLYLRAPDGVLFTLPQSQADPGATLFGALAKTKQQWLEEGNTAAREGRLDEALLAYQQAIQADPNDPVAYRRKGYILNQLQRFEEALTALREAIRLDPSYAHSYVAQGEALSGLRRYQEALAAYQRALELDPALPNAQSGRDRMQQLITSRSPAALHAAGPSLPGAVPLAPSAPVSAMLLNSVSSPEKLAPLVAKTLQAQYPPSSATQYNGVPIPVSTTNPFIPPPTVAVGSVQPATLSPGPYSAGPAPSPTPPVSMPQAKSRLSRKALWSLLLAVLAWIAQVVFLIGAIASSNGYQYGHCDLYDPQRNYCTDYIDGYSYFNAGPFWGLLLTGIVLTILLAVLSMRLGRRARKEIQTSDGRLRGSRTASTGVVLSWLLPSVWVYKLLALIVSPITGVLGRLKRKK